MNPEIVAFLKNHKKITIISIVILVFIFLASLIIIHLSQKSWLPLANENLLSHVPNSRTNDFKHYLERSLTNNNYTNISDATIRENSITTTQNPISDNNYSYTTTFLVDVDSIQQTYQASITWFNNPTNADDTLSISCPQISNSKYPDSECKTEINNSHDSILWLPYQFNIQKTPGIVKEITSDRTGKTIQIYLYSCDNPTPPIEATEKLIHSWVKDTIKDPEADKYHYYVRYGYCEGE